MQSSERQRLSATLSGLSQRQIHDDDTAVVITDSPTSSHLMIHESDSDNDDNHSNLNASPLPPLRSIIRYDSLSRAEGDSEGPEPEGVSGGVGVTHRYSLGRSLGPLQVIHGRRSPSLLNCTSANYRRMSWSTRPSKPWPYQIGWRQWGSTSRWTEFQQVLIQERAAIALVDARAARLPLSRSRLRRDDDDKQTFKLTAYVTYVLVFQ